MDVQRSTSIMLLALVAGFATAADTDDASYLGPPAFDAPQESDIAVELKIGPELQTAKALYQQAKWKDVVDQLTDLILLESQGPGAVDALFLRAEARVQLEEYAEALSDYQQLLTRKASQVQFTHAQFRVAELNHLLGQFDDAIAHLEKFRRREPKHELNAYILPYLAEAYEKTGKRDEARRIYVEALRKFPDGPKHIQCRLQIAILDYHRKRYESSRKLLDEVVTKTQAPSSYY